MGKWLLVPRDWSDLSAMAERCHKRVNRSCYVKVKSACVEPGAK